VAERVGVLRGRDPRGRDRVFRAAGLARRDGAGPAPLRPAPRPRPCRPFPPRPRAPRYPRHDWARGPGGLRRRGARPAASPPRMADGDAHRARRAGGGGELGGAAAPHERADLAQRGRPVARHAAGPGGGRRAADVRGARRAPRKRSPPRLDRALAPARQRVRRLLPARLLRGCRHAERVPRSGRRRQAPGTIRPLRGHPPGPVPRGAAGWARGGARAPAPGRHARRGLPAHPDLRAGPRGRARIRRCARLGRTPARARAARDRPGRPSRARRSTRRS
jgi:hypothetical protein